MKKLALLTSLAAVVIILGAGCARNGGSNQNTPADVQSTKIFSDPNTKVTFEVDDGLEKTSVSSAPGTVSVILKKRAGASILLDNIYFSTKTHDAWLQEKQTHPNVTCDNDTQPGCEKWDQDMAAYQQALTKKDYSGYYALGTDRVTLNGITYVVAVTYNLDTQQYQTEYVAYVNNTRITFVDPATGGLEYGFPFQMTAKNRELVELTASQIAKRGKIDDPKTRARNDELYQMVATAQIQK